MFWLVVDKDKWTDKQLNDVKEKCNKNHFSLTVSNPCFEYWLLLHFEKRNTGQYGTELHPKTQETFAGLCESRCGF